MTPEEIAKQIVEDDRWLAFDYVGDDDYKVPDVDRDALAHDIALLIHAYGDERARAERERAAQLVEQRRMQILADPHDPSWTEHFAELQNAIRAPES